ncbi:hypothetical protein FW796_16585 [Pseudomonas sp. 910_21]
MRPPGTISSVDKECCGQGTGHRSNRASSNSRTPSPAVDTRHTLRRSRLAGEEAPKPAANLADAFAGKPAPCETWGSQEVPAGVRGWSVSARPWA